MPRLARKNLESGFCHVITQGINREFIFKDKIFKESYRNLLKKNSLAHNIKILAYCIMDNHAHILIYTDRIENMISFMRKTNTSYSILYNSACSRVGYVFRDRYYTQMIKDEEQLLNCIVYIHNNPIEANMVKRKEDYEYSSYKEYLGKYNLIKGEGIKLVFGSEKNFKDEFIAIHKKSEITNIMDITGDEDASKIIDMYIKKYSCKIEDIVKNEDLFCDLLIDLRFKSGKSLREMTKIFGINKDKLNKVINKKL